MTNTLTFPSAGDSRDADASRADPKNPRDSLYEELLRFHQDNGDFWEQAIMEGSLDSWRSIVIAHEQEEMSTKEDHTLTTKALNEQDSYYSLEGSWQEQNSHLDVTQNEHEIDARRVKETMTSQGDHVYGIRGISKGNPDNYCPVLTDIDWRKSQEYALLAYRPTEKQRRSERELILRKGQQETQRAVREGRARVVRCHGCQLRLHAPVHYSLVYCPSCGVVSPGLSV